jgi:hypothetical protein
MWSRKSRWALISHFLGKEKLGNFKKPSSHVEEAAFSFKEFIFLMVQALSWNTARCVSVCFSVPPHRWMVLEEQDPGDPRELLTDRYTNT